MGEHYARKKIIFFGGPAWCPVALAVLANAEINKLANAEINKLANAEINTLTLIFKY